MNDLTQQQYIEVDCGLDEYETYELEAYARMEHEEYLQMERDILGDKLYNDIYNNNDMDGDYYDY